MSKGWSLRTRTVAAICGLLTASVALHSQATTDSRDHATIAPGEEPITPVPRGGSLDAAKVQLGEMLFHDVRLSRSDELACASCHLLAEGGDDNRPLSPGSDGELLNFNAPTVFNAALNFRLNWRGNFRTLEEQNEAVLLNARLMNTNWGELLPKLHADEAYREAFATVYRSDPAPAHVLDALATFQRSLTRPMHALTVTCAGSRMPSRQRKSAATSYSRTMAASPAIRA